MISKLLLIAAGGSIGALLRFFVARFALAVLGPHFPWGSLAVNVTGCFAIGVIWGFSERTPFSSDVMIFLMTGVLGAYTTFSSFGLETFGLFRDGYVALGLFNILISNICGLAGVLLGFVLGRAIPVGSGCIS